jgi:hypothetical protein
MRDVFPDEAAEGRAAPEFATNDAEASRIRDGLEAQQVCPFCGAVGDGSETVCPKCAMENNAAARKATKLRIGPWYVLQNRNPAAPGMKWETLLSFVRKGRIKPQSVVRGPTTHQLWRFAAHVKGLSREFGVCYSCGGSMEQGGNLCPHCNRLQEPPIHPDTLLEGSEPEARAPIYRELPVSEPAPPQAAPAELAPDIQEKLRHADEVLKDKREQGDAVDRLRQELEQEKEAAARDREAAQRERETVAREREAVNRDKEAIERDRLSLARDREAARRERELRGQTTDRAADGVEKPAPAPKPDTAVWDLPEPDVRPELLGSTPRKPSLPAEKPVNAGIGAKGRPPRDGGFLSAKDLAAAFKLNHQMALAARELKGQGDDTPAKGDDAPSRYKPAVSGSRRGSRRMGGRLFLIVLVVAWAVLIVWIVPSWHARVTAFWSRVSHATNSGVPAVAPVPAPEKTDEPPAATDPAPEGLAPTTIPVEPPPATLPAIREPAPANVIPSSPATAPGASEASSPVHPSPPAPAPVPPSAPPIPPPSAIAPPPTTAQSPAAVPLSANAQAKILYHQAMDAEIRSDMAEAARIYEEIEKLPQDAWPSDLELRLKLAKAQLKQ